MEEELGGEVDVRGVEGDEPDGEELGYFDKEDG